MFSAYVPKGKNSMNFILFDLILPWQLPWQCPKLIMIIYFRKKHEFLQPEIYSSKEPMKPMDLTRITQILSLSRLQGPVPVPSRTKDIQQAEF